MKKAARKASVATPRAPATDPPPRPPAPSGWKRHGLPGAVLVLFALLAYSNSFGTGLIFDSNAAILQDSRIQAATSQNIHALLTQDYWYADKTDGVYRPLTKLSFLFNYAVLGGGSDPAGYHLINFALHAANVLLVYFLGLLLFAEFPLAFSAAALWGVHPVLTESVTNVVGRADLLATFGTLAGLLCHAQATSVQGRRKYRLAGLALSAVIGLFSKETAVVLPAMMLVYDYLTGQRSEWRSRVQGYLAILAPFAVYFFVRARIIATHIEAQVGTIAFVQNPLIGAGFWMSRLTALNVIGRYILLWLWPARLSPDYSYNQIPVLGSLLSPQGLLAVVAFILCVVAVILALRWRRTNLAFAFFTAFFFIALAPVSNLFLIIGSIMAERFLYMPSIGLAALLVLGVFRLCARLSSRVPITLLACLCVACAVRTYARNADWNDEASLWASAVQAAPDSYLPHFALAGTAMTPGAQNDSVVQNELSRSLAILDPLPDDRNLAMPYATAGYWYRLRGDMQPPNSGSRTTWYQQSLAALLRAKKIDQATSAQVRRYNTSKGKPLRYYSSTPNLYLDLARTDQRLNQPARAAQELEYELHVNPQPEVLEDLAGAYYAAGDSRNSAIALQEGLIVSPADQRILSQLGTLYRRSDPGGCAVVQVGGRTAMNLRCPTVQADRCQAARLMLDIYDGLRQPQKAEALKQTAARDWSCQLP